MELEKAVQAAQVQAARKRVRQIDAETLSEMIALAQIPAPPFGEAERAAWMARRFCEIGLLDVCTDEIGNVFARLPAPVEHETEQPILLAAHLDTVFSADTCVDVRRDGKRILAPGIADNARGLAALLAVAKVLVQCPVPTIRPIVLVATVGEEGVGDLRGVKHLLRAGSPWRDAAGFITVDGTGRRRIVYRAIGSRRFAVTLRGPGGHSWADWGLVNPIHTLGLAVSRLAELQLPRQPKSALTVGRIGGGTSVNAIPADAWMEIDVRSEAGATLMEVEQQVRRILTTVGEDANAARRRGTPTLQLEIRVIGDRPCGETPVNSAIVRAARAATRLLGDHAEMVASSTDANVPIALGIPAIAIGAGGESGGTHTLDEWYTNDGGPEGIERCLLAVLGAAIIA